MTDLLANVRTGDYLEEKDFPDPTVGELLENGECTPMCLTAARPDSACACPCGGDWHGAATNLIIPAHKEDHL